MTKKIPVVGVATCFLYFLSVGLFLVFKTELLLTIWELLTVLSGPVLLLVLLELSDRLQLKLIYKNAMQVFMSCACSLTAAAHITNIAVTRKLMSQGVKVPEIFQIGYWPSVEMAVDYLAWGFFVGLAFLCFVFTVKSDDKRKQRLKKLAVACGILCLSGFVGAVFINENIWYVAPLGYGMGSMAICIQMECIERFH